MSSILLDGATFGSRLELLAGAWKQPSGALSKCDSFLIVVGNPTDTSTFQKSSVLHSWLLGYEFTDTLILLTKHGQVHFCSSQKKCSILESLSPPFPKERLVFHPKSKDSSNLLQLFDSLKSAMASGAVAILAGETVSAPTADEWQKFFNASSLQTLDVSRQIGDLLLQKDRMEISLLKEASTVACTLMTNFVVEELLEIVDQERRITHEKLSEKVEKFIAAEVRGESKRLKLPQSISRDFIDICYAPLIQSGPNAFYKVSSTSSSEVLQFGCIVCALGVRYRSYCSNLIRTYLIEPTAEKQKIYESILKLRAHLLALFVPGATLRSIYQAAVDWIAANEPSLRSFLPPTLGNGIGIEFKEASLSIAPSCDAQVLAGHSFNLCLSFCGLSDATVKEERNQKYSIVVGDMVVVTETGAITCLTDACPRTKSDVAYFFRSESDEERESQRKRTAKGPAVGQNKAVTRSSNNASVQMDNAAIQRQRKEHQQQLLSSLVEKMQQKYLEEEQSATAKKGSSDSAGTVINFESYKKEIFLPRESSDLRVYVDRRNDTLLLPMLRQAVPFHISTVKNASKSEEGEFSYLRINFAAPPTQQRQSTIGGSESSTAFVKSVTFRSGDSARVTEVLREINELRKISIQREAEKKEMADLVVQSSLVEIKGRRPHRLSDLTMRPSFEGKRIPGEVEIHANGIRYRNQLKVEQRVDILFDNIQHFFFQPCDDEMIVLLHCRLRNPIMIGKKRTRDVQFYREALEAIADETGAAARRKKPSAYGDEDEIVQEQEERKRRARLNEEFRSFSEKISEQANQHVEVDMPIRELGFFGVPGRQNVLFLPTKYCLVQLIDPPFTVVPMADVEFAHLERVVFGLKNFDLVLIMRDHKQPATSITCIPVQYLEEVKSWLDSMDVVYAESTVNLNWPNIMKTINEDPVGFYETGGWGFLQTESRADGSAASDDSDDDDNEDSAYEQSDEDEDEEYSDDEGEDEDEEDEDDDEEYSDDEDDDDYDSEEDEDEDEAPSWEELDREAERQDRMADQRSSKQSSVPTPKRKK